MLLAVFRCYIHGKQFGTAPNTPPIASLQKSNNIVTIMHAPKESTATRHKSHFLSSSFSPILTFQTTHRQQNHPRRRPRQEYNRTTLPVIHGKRHDEVDAVHSRSNLVHVILILERVVWELQAQTKKLEEAESGNIHEANALQR
jgi:hypothetical protein